MCVKICFHPHNRLCGLVFSVAHVKFTLIFSCADFFFHFLSLYSQSHPLFVLDVLADSQQHKTRRGSAGFKNGSAQSQRKSGLNSTAR